MTYIDKRNDTAALGKITGQNKTDMITTIGKENIQTKIVMKTIIR